MVGCGHAKTASTRTLLEVYHVTPDHSKLPVQLLRAIDAHRESTGDQGISSAVEHGILDYELAELTLEWMMNPESPRVPNVSQIL